MKKHIIVTAAAFVVAGVLRLPLAAQTAPFPSDSAIREILRDRVTTHRTVEIVVGLVDHGKHRVIAYGEPVPGRALDGNTVFEIGSITKAFTGVILADMALKDEVSLDDPVEKFLPPGTKIPARGGKLITLLDLSTQSSGLPRMPGNFAPKNPANPYEDYTVQNMYDFLATYDLPRDIGATYEYSNLGVGLLGHALSLRAKQSYEDLVRKRILEPLKMTSTGITLTPSMQQRLAKGHGPNDMEVANWDLPSFAGAGALRSTVNDMMKFIDANLSEKGPLASAFGLTQEPRRPAGVMRIGLNWHMSNSGDNTVIWHNGGTGGYRSFVAFNKASQRGVVVLTNSAKSSDDVGMRLMTATAPTVR